jgi:hypothetical protein
MENSNIVCINISLIMVLYCLAQMISKVQTSLIHTFKFIQISRATWVLHIYHKHFHAKIFHYNNVQAVYNTIQILEIGPLQI